MITSTFQERSSACSASGREPDIDRSGELTRSGDPRKPAIRVYRAQVIRLVVRLYVRYPLSPRNVEDLHERGIDICHETVRLWVNRFGPMFAGEVRKRRVQATRQHTHWHGTSTRSA